MDLRFFFKTKKVVQQDKHWKLVAIRSNRSTYKLRQNNWKKIEKSSKTGPEKKSLNLLLHAF